MLRIRKVLKTPFEGLNAPDESKSMFQAMRNAYELTYDIEFTSRHHESNDQMLQAEYFNSSQLDIIITSYKDDQIYSIEISLKEEELEGITHQFIDKYIDAYTTEELLDKAKKGLNQGIDRWLAVLMVASFQGSTGVDPRIEEVLREALSHPNCLIRRGACWITFANEDYWEVMLPILRKVQTEDPHEEVRSNAEGVIECMFWEE